MEVGRLAYCRIKFGNGGLMASKKTRKCAEFVRKLEALYEASQLREDLKPVLDNDASVARWLDKSRSLISTWRQGDVSKNREIGEIMPEHLTKLAERYSELTEGGVSVQEARNMWMLSSHEIFRRRLFQSEQPSIIRLLEEHSPTLDFALIILGTDFGLIETDTEPEDGEIEVPHGSYFSLSLVTAKGRSLIALGMNHEGLTLLAPGPQHDGRVNSSVESVPGNSSWKFNTHGPCRIIVLELPVSTPPIIRRRHDSYFLKDGQELKLVEELLDVKRSDGWRWAEKRLYITGPDGSGNVG